MAGWVVARVLVSVIAVPPVSLRALRSSAQTARARMPGRWSTETVFAVPWRNVTGDRGLQQCPFLLFGEVGLWFRPGLLQRVRTYMPCFSYTDAERPNIQEQCHQGLKGGKRRGPSKLTSVIPPETLSVLAEHGHKAPLPPTVPLHIRAYGGVAGFCVREGLCLLTGGGGALCSLCACGRYVCKVSLIPRVLIV